MTDLADPTTADTPPRAPVEERNAGGTISEVRFKDRVIEAIVVPYDQETRAPWPPSTRDHLIWESVAPGAFNGVERRAGSMWANRSHDRERRVGRVIALHPSRQEGLVAEVKIGRHSEGQDVLEMADEGLIDVSIGMAPMPDGQVWTENRTRRRITRAYVDHVAFTGDPAYPGAQVLSVRQSDRIIVPDPVVDEFSDEARAFVEQMRSQLPTLGA